MRYILSIALFLTLLTATAQNITISGKVMSNRGESLAGAIVTINPTTGTVSDSDGNFKFEAPFQEVFTLTVRLLGYDSSVVRVPCKPGVTELTLKLKLKEAGRELKEVNIEAQTSASQSADRPQTIAAINVKAVANRATSTFQLLNGAAGLRVRQTGGLGSNADISINGISGKQIKLFVDGIPLDNTGIYTAFYNVPVNLLDRIEIVKGVVPVYLGADALGGAINIVTRQPTSNYIGGSYERSSFHTNKSSFIANYFIPKTSLRVGVSSYYNESENDYKIEAEGRNPDRTTYVDNFTKFHDAFQSRMIKGELTLLKQSWTDAFSISYTATGARKEIQQNPYFPKLSVVFGSAFLTESSQRAELKFDKTSLGVKGLDLSTYFSYTKLITHLRDTNSGKYAWNGEEYFRNATGAEISGTKHELFLNTYNLLSRALLSYHVNTNHTFNLNVVLSNVEQKGQDTAASRNGKKPDVYAVPQYVRKTVAGFSFTSKFFNQRLVNDVGVKYYEIGFKAVSTSIFSNDLIPFTASKSSRGVFEAVRYELLKDRVFVKASYEYATRLPDQYEVLGDRVFIITNPAIKPEVSNNINAGFQLLFDGKLGKFTFDANYFNRYTKDNIYLAIAAASQYQNLATVLYRGFDADLGFSPVPFVNLKLNLTYQQSINRSDTTGLNPGIDKRFYNAQLPNKPVLFSNAEVNLFYPGLFKKNDRMQLYWWSNYTDKYYLNFAKDGLEDAKLRIPRQLVQNLGLSYTIAGGTSSLSLEAHNFENQTTYDYFKIQRPGRSYHVKLSFFLDKILTKKSPDNQG